MTLTEVREKWQGWRSAYACADGPPLNSREEAQATLKELDKAVALTPDRRQRPGVNSTGSSSPTATEGDPVALVDKMIAHLVREGYSQAEAAVELFKRDPGLQRRDVAAINEQKRAEHEAWKQRRR